MLLVHTYVAPSTISGLGLFAAGSIRKGTRIYRWDPSFGWTATPEEFAALPGVTKEFVERYGWRDRETGMWRASIDNSRFLNHSITPNTAHDANGQYALQDILPGEEITENYADFDPDFEDYAHLLK